MIEVGHASHIGLRRECNEDSYWADSALGLFLAMDGMGGHGRGATAAALARDALVDAARAGHGLEPAIRAAGTAMAARSAATPGHSPMGATLAWLKIDGGRFEAARIGDARVYLWHHDALTPLCTGDPAAESEGPSTADDEPAPVQIKRNRITQALGITPPPDLVAAPVRGALERDMQFLLCTDGLCEALDDREIGAVLARIELAAQECVDHLLLAALAAGGRDNVTALLVRVT